MVNPNKKNQDGANVDQVVQIRYKDEYSGTEVSPQLFNISLIHSGRNT